ncbi:MAG: hypothetical protein ACK5JS_00740 [Mangrovibacterium sp.]
MQEIKIAYKALYHHIWSNSLQNSTSQEAAQSLLEIIEPINLSQKQHADK